MKIPCILSMMLLSSLPVGGKDTEIFPLEAIQQKGSITITDGSSEYVFRKDGTFASGPLFWSGRTIVGTWTISKDGSGAFVVKGEFGWINGSFADGDFRTMVFHVYPGKFRKYTVKSRTVNSLRGKEIFDCYFLIEKLVRDSKKASQ